MQEKSKIRRISSSKNSTNFINDTESEQRKKSCNMFKFGCGCPDMAVYFGGNISNCASCCEIKNNLVLFIKRYRK